MPAYLATVPKQLPLDCAIPAEAAKAMPMLEAIEQRAGAQGVAVDARIERGRSHRHALERLLEHESFDRVVVPASASGRTGFSGEDLVWLLEKAPAEVLILRPGAAGRSRRDRVCQRQCSPLGGERDQHESLASKSVSRRFSPCSGSPWPVQSSRGSRAASFRTDSFAIA